MASGRGNPRIERNAFHFYFASGFDEQLPGTEAEISSSGAIA
jgi:hypothetical protein